MNFSRRAAGTRRAAIVVAPPGCVTRGGYSLRIAMGTIQPSTRALRASEVLDRFEQLLILPVYNNQRCVLTISTGLPGLAWTIEWLQGANPTNPTILAEAKSVLSKLTSIGCSSCQLARISGNGQDRRITYSCNDGLIGHVDTSGFDDDKQGLIAAFEQLEKLFELSMFVDIVTQSVPEVERRSLQLRERAVADLGAAQQKLEAALVEMSTKDAERRRALEETLRTHLQARETQLQADFDSKNAAMERQHQEKSEKLEHDRVEYEKRVTELDARKHRAARRSEHKGLDALLAGAIELKLGKESQAKRTRTERSIWGMIAATAVLALLSGWFLFFGDADFQWRHAVPFASSTFATWATLSYYIRWNDRWTREYTDAEISTRRYRVDAVRANWLAELVSEAHEEEYAGQLAPELITAFTRNLFSDPVARTETLHPLDRLVDQAKEIEIGKDKIRVMSGK